MHFDKRSGHYEKTGRRSYLKEHIGSWVGIATVWSNAAYSPLVSAAVETQNN